LTDAHESGGIAMPEPTVDHLLRRLQRVERANHTWRLAAVTASAVLGVLVLLGATGRQGTTPVEELRATRLVLVDAQGRPLGRVGVEADGTRHAARRPRRHRGRRGHHTPGAGRGHGWAAWADPL
jgi:hypothetical protein